MPNWLSGILAMSNLPGYGILIVMVITIAKTWPIIQKNLFDARENRESRYGTRIRDLEKAVVDCRHDCDEQTEALRREIRGLEEKLAGLRRQHVQEQLSLIAAIIESVDSPILKNLFNSLQTVQRALPETMGPLGEILGDAGKTPK